MIAPANGKMKRQLDRSNEVEVENVEPPRRRPRRYPSRKTSVVSYKELNGFEQSLRVDTCGAGDGDGDDKDNGVNDKDDDSDNDIDIKDDEITATTHNWMHMYHCLECYKQQFGNCRVPKQWEVDSKLARWVQFQRQRCEDDDRVDLLNELGFDWNPNHTNWMEMYNRLVAFKQKYGTTRINHHYKEDPKLGRWVGNQRIMCKKEDYINLLNEIDFIWDGRIPPVKEEKPKRQVDDWSVMYRRLVAHKEKTGSTRIVQRQSIDQKLGRWVVRQRGYCTKQYQIDLLNKIGFAWNGIQEAKEDVSLQERRANAGHELWMVMYRRLVAHKEKTGSTRIVQRNSVDQKLGRWVVRQRADCTEQYQIDLLNKIGFAWSGMQETKEDASSQERRANAGHELWMVMYRRLVAHKEKTGSAWVSYRHKDGKLARWFRRQRSDCRKQKQIDLLNDIGFIWDGKPRVEVTRSET